MPLTLFTAQKIKFSVNDLFSKCEQIRRELWNWSHLLNKSLMENFIFCAVIHLSKKQPLKNLSSNVIIEILTKNNRIKKSWFAKMRDY